MNDSRPQDRMFDQNMHCVKSHDQQHHFVTVRNALRVVQHFQCSFCGVHYDEDLHRRPVGYSPEQ